MSSDNNEVLLMLKEIINKLDNLKNKTNENKKEWYSPDELATLLHRKPYTVREWCRLGRISSQKDEYSGKRMIPTGEVNRLLGGGNLLPV